MKNPILGKVLIVDDETELMTALCESLAEQGYETTGFAAGQDALEALAEQDYDVLLTDLMMPGMDGVELLKRALVIDPHLVGVIMTGQGTVQTAVEAMKIGAVEYILKPFKLNVILPVVSRAMEMRHLRLENLQLRESVSIYELSQAVAHTLDLNIILNKVADAALQQCEADEVSIMLPTRDGRELYVATVRNGEERSSIVGTRVPIEQGIAGWVARQHEPVTLHGVVNDSRFAPIKPRPEIHSSMCLPMQVGGKCVGILNINAIHRRRPFSLGQVKAVSILAGTAAAALEGAWLYEQVREAEEKYRSIFENAAEGIFQTTPDGGFLTANPAMARMYGYESLEDLRANVTDLQKQVYIDPDRREEFLRLMQERGSVSNFEYQVRRKDGIVLWVKENARAVGDKGGKVLYYEGTVEDITEKKKAEEVLRAREVMFRELLESAPDAMVITNEAGEIVRVNSQTEKLLGYPRDELVGERVEALLPEQLRAHHLESREGYLADPHARQMGQGLELWARAKDGKEHPVEISLSPLNAVSGKLVIAAIRDITDRKRGEDRLREQFTRISLLNQIARAIDEKLDLRSIYHVVLQHVEDGLPVDMAGVLTYDSASDTFTIAARGPKSQVRAQELGLGEGARFPFEHTCFNSILKGEALYMPDLSKFGTPVQQSLAQGGFLSGVAVPLMVGGQLIGVLVVARREVEAFSSAECEFLGVLAEHVALAAHQAQLHGDLRKAYDELRDTQRAALEQERLSALGQMASGIVHDINNALSPITGFSQLLLMGETNLSETGRRQVETIETAAGDIAHIVARMREFYRKREEQEALQPVNPNDLIHQVIDLTRAKWRDIPQQSGIVIEVQTQLSEDLPLLRGIESEVREALTNLIFNAVDAMPEGGVIVLRTRGSGGVGDRAIGGKGEREKGRVERQTSPAHVAIEVSDTGVGMDEETRLRCLEPFYSTKGERGTGLGLGMVYGVMQRHEGDIKIESHKGKGTTMRLLFPVRSPEAEADGSAASNETETAPVRSLRILCVDDEPLLRVLVKEMLEKDGHTVEVADGGEAGVRLFRYAAGQGCPFDVVMTDLGMPYVDGREVARTVKGESPTTPVILLTGWGTTIDCDSDVSQEVDLVLSKPPKMNDLRRALRRVAAGPTSPLISL
ncbi:MAG: PAS domain S-box protein [Armatimonadetes bacterium]|nr:PAS domain S-box protein [Armatimonadota bacterium]